MKRIIFSEQAKADVRAIPQPIAMNILKGIHRLAESYRGDVKKLKGSNPPEFRLRIGDYRVRFTEESTGALRVHSVKNRKDAYR